jgi:predicted permease
MFADLRYRLRALVSRSAMDRELDDELRFHLDREIEKYVAEGTSRRDAERRARLVFGGIDQVKEEARDARGVALVDSVLQDVRYATRGLRSRAGYTAAIVVALGLGIGANTAMFGIVDRLLFRPPAYLAEADRVHRVYISYFWEGESRIEGAFSYRRFEELKGLTKSFDRMAAIGYRELAIGTGQNAREMTVGTVSAALFDFFDARPVLGRFFTVAEDTTPAGAGVAVLGYGFWQSRYGGATDVLGKTIYVGSQIYTIVGVAPERFVGVTEEAAPAVFVPITTFASSRGDMYFRTHNWSWLEIVARRRHGVSIERANADLTAAQVRSWNREAEESGRVRYPRAASARVRSEAAPIHVGRGPAASGDARIVTWVMGVAIVVLLVACANVANLQLTRAVARRREIALRLALGVTRRRLFQQFATESLLLALLGGLTGLAIAQWGGVTLRALFLRNEDAGIVVTDTRTVLFAGAATLGVALLTGLAPIAHALRDDAAGSLRAGSREGAYRRSRIRTLLLIFQGALSVVLLVGAGLFVSSLDNVRQIRLGYDVDPLLYVEGNLRGVKLSPDAQNALADRLLTAARNTPGVRAASLVSSLPFYTYEGRGAPIVEGRDSLGRLGRFTLQVGTPSYFETMGTRIVRGRGISAQDRRGSPPVIVVSAAMADAIWPGEDAVGKQMRFESDTMPLLTVVGVSENVRGSRLTGKPEFWYYLPVDQYRAMFGPTYPSVLVRVNGRAEDYGSLLRSHLQREMPGAAYVTTVTLREIVGRRQRPWEFGARMFVGFGGLALVLAAIGLYSVIAYGVAQRTQELGVRIALGASVRDVVRLVVGQGVAFAVSGIAIGSAVALSTGRWVEPLLFEQSARDPRVFITVAGALLVVAIAATLRPAIRATRVDPTVALRGE